MKKIILFLINCNLFSNDAEYVKDLNDRLGYRYFCMSGTRDKLNKLLAEESESNNTGGVSTINDRRGKRIQVLKDSMAFQENEVSILKYKLSEAKLKEANIKLEAIENEFHRSMTNSVVGFLSFEENQEIDQLNNSINEQKREIEIIKSEMAGFEVLMDQYEQYRQANNLRF